MTFIGDFNARTNTLSDHVYIIKYTSDLLCENDTSLDRYDFNVRYSMDVSKPNLFGYSLIEFCKNNDIYFVNGRIDKDCKIGKLRVKIEVL